MLKLFILAAVTFLICGCCIPQRAIIAQACGLTVYENITVLEAETMKAKVESDPELKACLIKRINQEMSRVFEESRKEAIIHGGVPVK